MTASDKRRLYADSMNVDPSTLEPRGTGEAYFAAGNANRDFLVALEPPDQTRCDAFMDYLSQEQKFLADLDAQGFQNIGCVRWQNGKAAWVTRKITRKSPAQPAPPRKQQLDREGTGRLA